VELTLVANRPLRIPSLRAVTFIQVAAGLDVADNEIVKRLAVGDLVITSDIPLAAAAVGKGGYALNPRGELYSEDNVKAHLDMRNFMDNLRGCGIETGGPPALSQRDRQSFANNLDKLLTRYSGNS
jgi:uncharacterized protein YaiI (UPF0178 family)